MHVGILFLWLFVELPLFFFAHVKAAAREAAKAGGAPKAPAAAAGPTLVPAGAASVEVKAEAL